MRQVDLMFNFLYSHQCTRVKPYIYGSGTTACLYVPEQGCCSIHLLVTNSIHLLVTNNHLIYISLSHLIQAIPLHIINDSINYLSVRVLQNS